MFSILDILKKHREEKRKQGAGEPVPPRPEAEGGCLPSSIFFNEETREPVSVFSALNKEIVEGHMRELAGMYDEAVALCRKMYVAQPDPALIAGALDPLLSRLVTAISEGNREAVKFFLADYADIKEYLYYHVVNVCLLSIELGLEFKYGKSILLDLARSAFLHDIGMAPMLPLIMRPCALSAEELAKVRQHPKTGAEILAKFGRELPANTADTAMQEHERFDGSGYPKGLSSADIFDFARIVGVADVYEALTHSRPYRPPQTPSRTVTMILELKRGFDPKMVKALIERVGIFPEGTRVRLNTRETAVVIKASPSSPLRPVVMVVADAQGNELKLPKEINLCKNYLVHIEENLGN
jgi:HD-GYP domain-containing protein (c-di-GMP phosphodiesterase class II)